MPPIQPKSFVVAVNGMPLDKFGMVKSDKSEGARDLRSGFL